jgi:hypothetical protein
MTDNKALDSSTVGLHQLECLVAGSLIATSSCTVANGYPTAIIGTARQRRSTERSCTGFNSQSSWNNSDRPVFPSLARELDCREDIPFQQRRGKRWDERQARRLRRRGGARSSLAAKWPDSRQGLLSRGDLRAVLHWLAKASR